MSFAPGLYRSSALKSRYRRSRTKNWQRLGHFPFKVFDWLQQITVIIATHWLVPRFTGPDIRAALGRARVHGPNIVKHFFFQEQSVFAARW